MIALLNEFLLAAGAWLAATIVLKATVVATLGLFGAWLLRRRRAALRHAVLAAAFGVLLVLPPGAIFTPPVRVAVMPSGVPAAAVFSSSADSARNTPVPLTISAPSMCGRVARYEGWLSITSRGVGELIVMTASARSCGIEPKSDNSPEAGKVE